MAYPYIGRRRRRPKSQRGGIFPLIHLLGPLIAGRRQFGRGMRIRGRRTRRYRNRP